MKNLLESPMKGLSLHGIQFDAKKMREREQFVKENSLKSSDIESLFSAAIEVVDDIKDNLGFAQDLHKVFIQAKKYE